MALFCISLFFPLLSFIFAAALSHAKRLNFVGLVCSFLILCSATASLMQATIVFDSAPIQILLKDFIWVDGLRLNFGFTIDAVSATMMCVVGVVSTIVHIYSIGYMGKDDGFNRYFSYLGLFVFCMMFLVMSDNFVGLFIGWEGVGLCSWLLIGFWYQRSSANAAANEAFVMNRIADLGMLLGMFFIFKEFGSLKFSDVFADAPTVSHQALNFIAAFLFIGAMGKSAQFPFHTWLANAMEGPTPVSALIHAATMVTAGVYLVVRANAIFAQAPEISTFIAYLGAFVAVFAASIALVHNDLKKIIAYSTLSQLGYMFVAAGLGAYWVALFHLMTHAFFKSLLFLGAGNVMHAMRDELDIKKMGGLYKFMKPTAVLMAIGSVALAGFYPFAGFFSKDKILEVAFANGGYTLWAVLFAGALMTAFYSFRLLMLVFFGEAKFKFHPHEAKNFMLTAMGVLGVLALISGWFGSDLSLALSSVLPKFELNLEYESEVTLILLTLISITLSTLFTIFAYKKRIFKEELGELKIYKILQNAYFIPKFYERFVIKNYAKAAKFCRKMDEAVIDKSVDGISKLINAFAFNANKMQSGELTRMLRLMVTGFAILLSFIFLLAGGA
ncbi:MULTISPECIES: NADH-quinone oxidoreductase subunit L [Campylobacter]|uniref:NADH-quinone oxidoreductase subunit L n=1 Tax=Campylobacter TaxID=194 RepID=UPI00146FD9D5|nr:MULTISPECIES: NADH-quinone oxidoreductase subunit L [Campylobacter]MBN7288116.1 NADH-quinone oxidoreductase subunit L [Campylobacter curvus]MDU6828358.1 NADH-quinone oxidoreductase subunit L [Campylobacter sp.]